MMNNDQEPASLLHPIDQQFIVAHIKQLLIDSESDPDLSWLYPLIQSAIVEATLIHTHGSQQQAAKILGIHRFTVRSYYDALKKWKPNPKQIENKANNL